MEKIVISTDKLSKSYFVNRDEFEVVRDVSIEIHEKEFVCILGPSGCGKTTLLEMIGGIEKPTSGTVTIGGKISDKEKGFPVELRKKIGFVYQEENLFPWRSAEKNLRLPLEVFGMVDEKTPERINEVLELVGLEDYATVLPGELSGGMKQRVTIARAMVYNPDIVIMDQPFGALDAITRDMLARDFLKIWQETQKTFVMVTNSLHEALFNATRIIALSDTPTQVIEEIDVDIPYEQRNAEIALLPRHQELLEHLASIYKR